jgi:hypothetical protein
MRLALNRAGCFGGADGFYSDMLGRVTYTRRVSP